MRSRGARRDRGRLRVAGVPGIRPSRRRRAEGARAIATPVSSDGGWRAARWEQDRANAHPASVPTEVGGDEIDSRARPNGPTGRRDGMSHAESHDLGPVRSGPSGAGARRHAAGASPGWRRKPRRCHVRRMMAWTGGNRRFWADEEQPKEHRGGNRDSTPLPQAGNRTKRG